MASISSWTEAGRPDLALSVLELHLHSHEWVHHRLHQITFQDDTTVRHSFTVDFTVPEQTPTLRVLKAQEVRLLPIDLLRKQNLVNFELYDQEGRRLSYLTRNQLGILTNVMLAKYAEGLLNEPLPHAIAMCLQDFATRDAVNIERAQERWEHIIFSDPSVQNAKDRLDTMVEFTSILKRLTDNFILLIPIDTSPGTRLNVRYCLDVPIEPVRLLRPVSPFDLAATVGFPLS